SARALAIRCCSARNSKRFAPDNNPSLPNISRILLGKSLSKSSRSAITVVLCSKPWYGFPVAGAKYHDKRGAPTQVLRRVLSQNRVESLKSEVDCRSYPSPYLNVEAGSSALRGDDPITDRLSKRLET